MIAPQVCEISHQRAFLPSFWRMPESRSCKHVGHPKDISKNPSHRRNGVSRQAATRLLAKPVSRLLIFLDSFRRNDGIGIFRGALNSDPLDRFTHWILAYARMTSLEIGFACAARRMLVRTATPRSRCVPIGLPCVARRMLVSTANRINRGRDRALGDSRPMRFLRHTAGVLDNMHNGAWIRWGAYWWLCIANAVSGRV